MNHPHVAERKLNAIRPKLLCNNVESLFCKFFRPNNVRTVGGSHSEAELPRVDNGNMPRPSCNEAKTSTVALTARYPPTRIQRELMARGSSRSYRARNRSNSVGACSPRSCSCPRFNNQAHITGTNVLDNK